MVMRLPTAATITRPANTTAYASGDVITSGTAAALVFGTDAPAGRVRSATLIDGACQATKLDADLFLFDATLTPDADNAAFTPTDAEMATCIGVISFAGSGAKVGDATSGADGNVLLQSGVVDLPFVSPGRALYGVLVARNAYTPVSAETFVIRLGVET